MYLVQHFKKWECEKTIHKFDCTQLDAVLWYTITHLQFISTITQWHISPCMLQVQWLILITNNLTYSSEQRQYTKVIYLTMCINIKTWSIELHKIKYVKTRHCVGLQASVYDHRLSLRRSTFIRAAMRFVITRSFVLLDWVHHSSQMLLHKILTNNQ